MIGNKLIINKTINLHKLGVVEVTEFEKLSSTTYYKDVAERPSRYKKRHFRTKSVKVQIRVIEENREKTKEKIDEIVGLSYSDNPVEFYLDDKKWCMAIIEEANDSLFFKNGLLELEFTNIYGYWLGNEKTSTGSINLDSIIDSRHLTVEFVASGQTVTIANSEKRLLLTNLLIGAKYRINFFEKTAKHVISETNQEAAEIDLSSVFFTLVKGSNVLSITGANGATFNYREVVAL